jgi:hypothetical protein
MTIKQMTKALGDRRKQKKVWKHRHNRTLALIVDRGRNLIRNRRLRRDRGVRTAVNQTDRKSTAAV